MFDYWPFQPNRVVTILLGSIGCAFFGALLVFSIRRKDHRRYLPGLLLICAGCVSVFVRGLFANGLSAHPASAGGVWRLLTAAVLVAGATLCERAWRRRTWQ